MGQLRKLARHSSHYMAGRALLVLLGLISFPIFTRVLSIEQYGLLNLVMSVVFAVTAIAKMGMQQALQRFYGQHVRSGEPGAFTRYFSTMYFGTLLIGLLTAGIYVALLAVVPNRVLGPELRYLLVIAAGLLLIRPLQSMVSNLLQVEGKTIAFNSLEFAVKALTVAIIPLVLLRWERTTRAYLIAMIAIEAAVCFALIPYLLRRAAISLRTFDARSLRTAIAFGAPLMWAELGALVLDTGDRVLVQYVLGTTALGYYSAAYGIAQYVRELLVFPVSLALFPVCMETWHTQGEEPTKRFLSQGLRNYLALAIGLMCLLTLTARDVLVILASKKYEPAFSLLPVLVAGLLVGSLQIFARIPLMIRTKPGVIVRSTFLAILVNVALNLALLPVMGIMGAALATLFSFTLQVYLTGRDALREMRIAIDYASVARFCAAAAAIIVVGLQVHLENVWMEATARTALALLYVPAVLFLDRKSRDTALRIASPYLEYLHRA